jgi:hypothetical protein
MKNRLPLLPKQECFIHTPQNGLGGILGLMVDHKCYVRCTLFANGNQAPVYSKGVGCRAILFLFYFLAQMKRVHCKEITPRQPSGHPEL